MKLIKILIEEFYRENGEHIPLITLTLKDLTELPNLSYAVQNSDGKYILDFRYDFFDSLSLETINFFENEIFSSSNTKYLDKSNWKKFKIYYDILANKENKQLYPTIKLQNKTYIINNNQKNIILIDNKSLENKDTKKTYSFNNKIIGHFGNDIPDTEINVKEEKEFLFVFLEIFFTFYSNYKIIKCHNCNKYFFAEKSDTLYCNRIFEENKTCKNFVKCKNLHNGKGDLPVLSKRMYELQKKRKNSTQYLINQDKMLKIFKNNKYAQTKFYLSAYEKTPKGQNAKEKTIKDLDLQQHLDKKNIWVRPPMFSTTSSAIILSDKDHVEEYINTRIEEYESEK